jgi:hypothetical protein
MQQSPIDLFGEVIVTMDDLYNWVAAVSPVHLSERGFDLYVHRWNVAGKVRAAKLAGHFDTIIAQRRSPYHARLALHAIL